MSGELIVLTGADDGVRDQIAAALHGEGYKVFNVPSEEAAVASLGVMNLVSPDLVLTALQGEGTPPLVAHLRANPLTEDVPILLFANGTHEERRRALRLGILDLLQRPYDPEDVLLMVRLALERSREKRRSGQGLRGTLSMLPLAELLQSLEAGRRSCLVELSDRGRTATLWVREGRVIEAESSDGRRGEEAVYALFLWSEGTFTVTYGPVLVPEKINVSTTGLLLEAARRADEESQAGQQPPFASIPDPPPAPPVELMAAHRAVTLLNISSAYAANLIQPSMLASALEESRQKSIAGGHSILDAFEVLEGGQISIRGPASSVEEASRLISGAAKWLLDFFARMNRAFPGHFEPARLVSLSEAVRDDMESLGFYSALGLSGKDA